jgi:hypothetical protein
MTTTTRRRLSQTQEIPAETVAQLLSTPKSYRDECYETECAITREMPALTDEEMAA